MSDKFALGIKTMIYNEEMRSRRKAKGLTQAMLAKVVGLTTSNITDMETFKWYPAYEKLEDVADFLGSTVEVIFPDWIREQKIERSTAERSIYVDQMSLNSHSEAMMIEAPADLTEAANKSVLKDQVSKFLPKYLTPREIKIIDMRFGLQNGVTHTLEQVGQEFGMTRDRIRQIEAKALKKLHRTAEFKSMKELVI